MVGAGLTGLVAAHALEQSGASVIVLEAAAKPGGVLGTHRDDGLLVETGANSVLDNTPLLARLFDELGIADERVDTAAAAAKRYIVREGKPVALPMTPPALLASSLFSARAKLRLLCEPFVPRAVAASEESIAAFVRRRLGTEFLDYAADPFVSGVYAGDPEAISFAAAFPRLHALEQAHGSLFRGQLANARARKRSGEPVGAPRSFSFRGGMQTLPDALARRLSHYTDRTEVVSIDRSAPGGAFTLRMFRDESPAELRARAVVVATPAYATARLVPVAAHALAAIAYAPVAIVATAYRREDVAHALDGFGMLVPGREQRRILGALFSSTLFAGRAPDGEVLLTSFVGGRRQPALAALDDHALSATVAHELLDLLGARAQRWSSIVRWPRAIPQYALGHRERVRAALDATATVPGLYLCGSWRDGVAVGDRVVSGYAIADEVRGYLERSREAAMET